MALKRSELNKILNAFKADDESLENSVKALLDMFHSEIDSEKDRYDELSTQYEELKKSSDAGNEWKSKFDKEHEAFDKFKNEVAEKESKAIKSDLYKALLKEAKVDEKRLDTIMRCTDLSSVTVKDGKLENADALKEAITKDWSDFIQNTETKGADTKTPPENHGGTPTDLDKLSMADYIAARKKG